MAVLHEKERVSFVDARTRHLERTHTVAPMKDFTQRSPKAAGLISHDLQGELNQNQNHSPGPQDKSIPYRRQLSIEFESRCVPSGLRLRQVTVSLHSNVFTTSSVRMSICCTNGVANQTNAGGDRRVTTGP